MTKSKIRDWIPGPRFRHFPKIFPRIFPKIFPNSSCKNIIKSYLFGAVHTGVLIKNGLGKILGKIFGKCLNWGPGCHGSELKQADNALFYVRPWRSIALIA